MTSLFSTSQVYSTGFTFQLNLRHTDSVSLPLMSTYMDSESPKESHVLPRTHSSTETWEHLVWSKASSEKPLPAKASRSWKCTPLQPQHRGIHPTNLFGSNITETTAHSWFRKVVYRWELPSFVQKANACFHAGSYTVGTQSQVVELSMGRALVTNSLIQ